MAAHTADCLQGMDSDPRSSIIEAMPPRDAAETLVEIARGAAGGDALDGEQLQAAALADMKAPAASNILAHMTFKVRGGGGGAAGVGWHHLASQQSTLVCSCMHWCSLMAAQAAILCNALMIW